MSSIFDLLLVLIGVAVYLLPTIVSFARKKDNRIMVAVMNVLIGWTIIGWVILLLEAADII